MGGSIALKKRPGSPGFILAEAMVTLWLVTLLSLTYCAIDIRASRQEQHLAKRAELASQLLSRSQAVISHPDQQPPTKIEVHDGTEKITVEIKR